MCNSHYSTIRSDDLLTVQSISSPEPGTSHTSKYLYDTCALPRGDRFSLPRLQPNPALTTPIRARFRHVNLAKFIRLPRDTYWSSMCRPTMRLFGQKKENQTTKSKVFDVTSRHPTRQSPLPRNTMTFPRFSPHIGNGAVRVYRLRATRPLTRQSSGNWISLPCLPCPESLDALTRPFREAHLLPVSDPRRPRCTTSPQNSTLHSWDERESYINFWLRAVSSAVSCPAPLITSCPLSFPMPAATAHTAAWVEKREPPTSLAAHTPTASCL